MKLFVSDIFFTLNVLGVKILMVYNQDTEKNGGGGGVLKRRFNTLVEHITQV